MKIPPYLGRALLGLFVGWPLLFQLLLIGWLFSAVLTADIIGKAGGIISGVLVALIFLFLCAWGGWKTAARYSDATSAAEERRFVVRYLPVMLACAYTLVVALIALTLPLVDGKAVFHPFAMAFALAHLPSVFVLPTLTMMTAPSPWVYLAAPLSIYAAYGLGLAWGFRKQKAPRTYHPGRFTCLLSIGALLVLIMWRMDFITRGFVVGGGQEAWFAEKAFKFTYYPFDSGNRLVAVPTPSLKISSRHPRLDGATALFPVYAAAVHAIYQNIDAEADSIVKSSTTPKAYAHLIAGDVDLAFVAQPSDEQRAAAEAAGRTLQLTPFAKEAFVFFVHEDNPINALTSEQIRAIYTKRITNWKTLGGYDEAIIPFQRPAGSGSQTTLELKVMKGEKPSAPLREEFVPGMGGLIQRVASYRNSRQSIGYSFRVFATAMNTDDKIKFLSVDGVAPTRENIRSGAYPYTVELFAATAGTDNPHVPELIAWFLGPQGQRLIDQTGYVSLASE